MRLTTFLFLIAALAAPVLAEDFYCGDRTCYAVMGLERGASAAEIRRAYRALSLQLHPDKNEAEDAPEQFQLLVTAYELLRDEESRNNYDHMLDHPEQYYRNIYNYYRYRSPRIPVTPILIVMTTIISALQYAHAWSTHRDTMERATRTPQLRQRAARQAEESGLFKGKLSKAEKEDIISMIVRKNIDLRGAFGPADWRNVLWARILFLPYTLSAYVGWWVYWIYRINFQHQEYTHEDLIYLICRNLRCSRAKFDCFDDETKEELFDYAVWDPENYAQYEADKKEEQLQKLRGSGKYKQMQRFKKRGGSMSYNYND